MRAHPGTGGSSRRGCTPAYPGHRPQPRRQCPSAWNPPTRTWTAAQSTPLSAKGWPAGHRCCPRRTFPPCRRLAARHTARNHRGCASRAVTFQFLARGTYPYSTQKKHAPQKVHKRWSCARVRPARLSRAHRQAGCLSWPPLSRVGPVCWRVRVQTQSKRRVQARFNVADIWRRVLQCRDKDLARRVRSPSAGGAADLRPSGAHGAKAAAKARYRRRSLRNPTLALTSGMHRLAKCPCPSGTRGLSKRF